MVPASITQFSVRVTSFTHLNEVGFSSIDIQMLPAFQLQNL